MASYTTGDATTTSTASLKGARARIELGTDLVTVQACDEARTLQLNTRTKTYLATPFDTAIAEAPRPEAQRKGGQIVFTTTVTDTGETQEVFGFRARHLRTVIVKSPGEGTCDRTSQRVEADGWYIDVPEGLTCVTPPARQTAIQIDPERPDCVDHVTYAHEGPAPGYPIRYTAVATTGTGTPVTTAMEAARVERTDVPLEAVQIPADYIEVQTVRQLTADHRPGEFGPRKPGVFRVGVAPVTNRTDAAASVELLSELLTESLSESEMEFVLLRGSSPAEIESGARAKECDFILQSTISELKSSKGGMMSRISGGSTGGFTAKVDFSLVAPGQSKPAYSSSERSGASTLSRTVAVVKKAAQFAPPVMMARYGYMNAYGAMLNRDPNAGAAMPQTSDPVLNSAFALLAGGSAKDTLPAQNDTEDAAVASAMEKEVRAVINELTKRKK